MTGTLPPAGYAADAPRPPMRFSVDVPDHWTVLDLNPETWVAWLDAFLDDRLAGPTNRSAERASLRTTLLDVLRQLHREKVFMAALLVADVAGDVVSANASLAWHRLDTHGDGIPVEGLYAVYTRAPAGPGEDLGSRRVTVVPLPAGDAVRMTTRKTMQLAGMRRPATVALTQYFVPVGDDWLGTITTGTGTLPLSPAIEEVADGMAESLRVGAP